MPLPRSLNPGAYPVKNYIPAPMATPMPKMREPAKPLTPAPLEYDKYAAKEIFTPEEKGLLAEKGQAEKEMQSIREKYAPMKEAAQARLSEVQKQAPKMEEPKPIPEFKPPALDTEAVRTSMGSLMGLAMLGGLLSRQSGTGAIMAMRGIIDGWQAGNKETFDRELKIYEKNRQAIILQNNQLQQAYQNAFNKHSGDVTAAMNEIYQIATKEGDEITQQLAKSGNISEMVKTIGDRQKQNRKEAADHEKLMKNIETKMELANMRLAGIEQRQAAKGTKETAKKDNLLSPVELKGKPLESWTNNYAAIEAIDTILKLPPGKIDEAMGLKTLIPENILNRIFPESVGTRASILDFANIQLKYRSGQAVSGQEFDRAKVALPTKGNDENTIRQKLQKLREFAVNLNNAMLVKPHELSNEPAQSAQQAATAPAQNLIPVARAEYGGRTYIRYSDGSVKEAK